MSQLTSLAWANFGYKERKPRITKWKIIAHTGVIEQTFPHSRSSPRKFCYIANYPPRGKICYIANVPHSRTSHLHVIGSNFRQHAKIFFWKSSPFAITKFLVMVQNQTLRIFDRLFFILCDKSSRFISFRLHSVTQLLLTSEKTV